METEPKPLHLESVEYVRLVVRVVFSVDRPLIPPPSVRVGANGVAVGRDVQQGISLTDPRVSRHHATLRSGPECGLSVIDHASKNGTFVNGERVTERELVNGDVLSVGDSCLVIAEEPPEEVDEGRQVVGLLGDSATMRRTRTQVRSLASTNLTVLLIAETGTGKEVVARALHALSGSSGPFVAVNCAAIPENLFESQFFGHTKSAFTGATAHLGFFRAAIGGTLFLDEVGELPLGAQPKLLRALEERAVIPLGSTRPSPCPVRIIAATHRELAVEVQRGAFRADLLARLFEASLCLPPLRQRREDVLAIFMHAVGGEMPAMTHSLAEAMLLHRWPFNVRELLAAARDVAAASRGRACLDPQAFNQRLRAFSPRASDSLGGDVSEGRDGRGLSPEELKRLLSASGGTVSEVARQLGRSRRQVYRWIDKYGIRVADFRR